MSERHRVHLFGYLCFYYISRPMMESDYAQSVSITTMLFKQNKKPITCVTPASIKTWVFIGICRVRFLFCSMN